MKKYDVVIAGGGTAGCACAYIAGKLGLKVLLVEQNSFLGGSITSSLVIPAMKTADNAINTEFFDTLYSKLEKVGGAITYCDGNKGWFNPELAKVVLDEMIQEANVEVFFESSIDKVEEILSGYNVAIRNNNLIFSYQELLPLIETKYLIDGTGDAKICQKLNCEKLENEKFQPSSLRFIMSGVDVKTFSDWLMEFDKDRNVTTSCKIDGKTYLSTACTWDSGAKWALRPLFEQAIEDGVLKGEDTNYFQIFSVAGTSDSIAFNAPRLLDNAKNRSKAYIDGRAAILRLSVFCKKYLPGFKDAHISSIANSLGVRVSTRIKGKYVYTAEDLRSGKTFENPVVVSNYPIDIHSDKKDNSVLEKVFQQYQLPVESLMVRDNLFVIGRSISAEFEAQAALRIIPSCFSMGEGLARYLAEKLSDL